MLNISEAVKNALEERFLQAASLVPATLDTQVLLEVPGAKRQVCDQFPAHRRVTGKTGSVSRELIQFITSQIRVG